MHVQHINLKKFIQNTKKPNDKNVSFINETY